jgi:hypothetical protein
VNLDRAWLLANGIDAATLDGAMSGGAAAVAELEPPSPRRGRMNKTERRFADDYLQRLKDDGTIGDFAFEPVRLLIADTSPGVTRAYYTPDFASWGGKDVLTFWEIKGHWREAARLRIKVAAERHPWAQFIAVKREGGQWQFEFIGRGLAR